jgi:nitrate/nitrite transporter NarK
MTGTIGYYVSGHLSDKVFKTNRQTLIIVGAIGGAVFTYLTMAASSGVMAVIWQMIGFFFITIATAAIYTLPVAGLPSGAAGSAIGIVNTAGQIAGFLSPLLVGYILSKTHGNFNIAFYLIIVCLLLAAFLASRIKQYHFRGGTANEASY